MSLMKYIGGGLSRSRAGAHALAKNGMSAARQGGEAIVTGGILGAIVAERGTLDFPLKLSPTNTLNIPIDGAIGVGALALSLVPSFGEVDTDLRNVGSNAIAIAAFRKTQQLIAAKKAGATAHGDFDAISDGDWGSEQDPLIAAARALG